MSVIVCVEVLPVGTDPKATADELTVILGTPTAMPVSVTAVGELGSELEMRSCPVRGPTAEGWKVTVMWHCAFGARVEQPFAAAKSLLGDTTAD